MLWVKDGLMRRLFWTHWHILCHLTLNGTFTKALLRILVHASSHHVEILDLRALLLQLSHLRFQDRHTRNILPFLGVVHFFAGWFGLTHWSCFIFIFVYATSRHMVDRLERTRLLSGWCPIHTFQYRLLRGIYLWEIWWSRRRSVSGIIRDTEMSLRLWHSMLHMIWICHGILPNNHT